MKRDTKKEILAAAKKLFNEQGFNAVSIRDIADVLGISSGNLTYYFNKKEEIMEALIEDTHDTKPTKTPQSIEELNYFFLDMQCAVQENAYYFWHHAQLSQLSPKIRDKQKNRYDLNVKTLREALDNLNAQELIRSENFSGEYFRVIDTLLLSNIYWIPFNKLKGSHKSSDTYQNHAWAIMHNLLTDAGRNEVLEILDAQSQG